VHVRESRHMPSAHGPTCSCSTSSLQHHFMVTDHKAVFEGTSWARQAVLGHGAHGHVRMCLWSCHTTVWLWLGWRVACGDMWRMWTRVVACRACRQQGRRQGGGSGGGVDLDGRAQRRVGRVEWRVESDEQLGIATTRLLHRMAPPRLLMKLDLGAISLST